MKLSILTIAVALLVSAAKGQGFVQSTRDIGHAKPDTVFLDALVSAWDAYVKECRADSFQRQNGWVWHGEPPQFKAGQRYEYYGGISGDTLRYAGYTIDGKPRDTFRWKSKWFKGSKRHYEGPYIHRTPTFPGFIEYLRKR
jgi:hypothetical protein